MPSHADSRARVCAVCWNRKGKKICHDYVLREGSDLERGIRDHIDGGYSVADMHTPSGICVDCRLRLTDWVKGKPNPRRLLIPTGFELGRIAPAGEKCECHICYLAQLNGKQVSQLRSKN